MIKNYIKVAIRSLLRDKFYSFINIFGLAMGIGCCLLILIYVTDELSYDRFHEKADRTFRLTEMIETEGSGEKSSSMPFPVGPTLQQDYPDFVEAQLRMFNFQSPHLLVTNRENNLEFNEKRVLFVDSTFLEIFDYEMVRGNRATALSEPRSVLITETMAQKYYQGQDPIGKVLRMQDQQDLVITGVMKDAPKNAHFEFDFLVSFTSLKDYYNGNYPRTWYWNPCWTYVVLKENVNPDDLAAVFPDFIQKYFPPFIANDTRMVLQPMTDIHLKSELEFEIQKNSSESNIYVFTVIGIFILFIASINYMNLSTAKSVRRAKEVGMRKTLGGLRSQLITQFLTESMLITLAAMLLSVAIVALSLPAFNAFAGKGVTMAVLVSPIVLAGLGLILLLVGLGSGIYPALVLSSFSPIKGLKGTDVKGKGTRLRKALVVLQFSLSIVMIIGTVVAINQLDFLRKSDTGFDKDNIVYISALRTPIGQNYKAFKNDILTHTNVTNVTAVQDVLGAFHQGDNFRFEGMEQSKLFSVFWMRHDFVETFDLEMVAGRGFKEHITTDDTSAIIINEAMARQLNWETEAAIGKRYQYNQFNGSVVGVVKDFNFVPKHRAVNPLVLQLRTNPGAFNLLIKYIAVKVNGENIPETLRYLENKWNAFVPSHPFDYFFLDDELNKQYVAEDKLSKVAGVFSGLAIIVACLGLFALASFMTEQRKKEIAVRKVMGGSVMGIVMLLSKDFTRLIMLAFVIATPLAFVFTRNWLRSFAYQIEVNWIVFVMVGLATLLIAILTISYQSIKAASSNPVKSLKYE